MADRSLSLGIAGLGTVGSSVLQIIDDLDGALVGCSAKKLHISGVSAQNRDKDRGVDLSQIPWFDDPVALAEAPQVNIFLELIGGEDGPALNAVTAALKSGKHVVTANKALVAKHGLQLAKLAEKNGVSLGFEAAIAGGIPIVKCLRESLAGNHIKRVYGILNGTCNYILTRMGQDQLSFEECLAAAQELGFAEADPTFDIGGFDAGHKLSLLSSLAFGTEVSNEATYIEGISSITLHDIRAAEELGYRIKLLGVAQKTDTGIEQRVHPTMVPKSAAIAGIDGVLNAVAVEGDVVGSILQVGPGAGGRATASSVLSDLGDIMRGTPVPVFGRQTAELQPHHRARMRAHLGGYYIRISVIDRPGGFAKIAKHMAAHSISLESIVQHGLGADEVENANRQSDETEFRTAVLITYATTEENVRNVLEVIAADNVICDKPRIIRIEHFE